MRGSSSREANSRIFAISLSPSVSTPLDTSTPSKLKCTGVWGSASLSNTPAFQFSGLGSCFQVVAPLAFANASSGEYAANGGILRYTTNGGSSWIDYSLGTGNDLQSVGEPDLRHSIAVGSSGTISQTTKATRFPSAEILISSGERISRIISSVTAPRDPCERSLIGSA